MPQLAIEPRAAAAVAEAQLAERAGSMVRAVPESVVRARADGTQVVAGLTRGRARRVAAEPVRTESRRALGGIAAGVPLRLEDGGRGDAARRRHVCRRRGRTARVGAAVGVYRRGAEGVIRGARAAHRGGVVARGEAG